MRLLHMLGPHQRRPQPIQGQHGLTRRQPLLALLVLLSGGVVAGLPQGVPDGGERAARGAETAEEELMVVWINACMCV